jgi:nucleoid-associated protein YgaU
MSSEAKVGLLVGLAFVFVISFLINGIPKIGSPVNNNELTANMIKPQTTEHAIAAKERKAARQVQSFGPQPIQIKKPQDTEPDIRFQMPLANNSSPIEQSPPQPVQAQPEQTPDEKQTKTIIEEKSKIKTHEYYVVQQGDNLSLIAQRFYGPSKGNKIKNIAKIYNANSNTLTGPDEIFVGQKLVIPALDSDKIQQANENRILPAGISKEVKTADSNKNKKHTEFYVVRDGDSLWQIAELHLGNGARYKEIARLNEALLDDENNLSVGMKLRLPQR